MSFDLTSFAKAQGWSLAGVSDLKVSPELKIRYREWLRRYKGNQMKYLERRMEERLDPRLYFKEAQSILCFGLYYFPGWARGEVKVSNYAWGPDYHDVLSSKLKSTIESLQEKLGSFEYRICVDTAPVLEKYWAEKAGLGWQGKNTLLLNKDYGSLFLLGEVLCSLPPETFQANLPLRDHCGTCRRCIEACPTQALEERKLKASLCISYLTLEHKGDFTESTPSLDGWVAGCDICQEVCPWNQKLIPIPSDETTSSFQTLSLSELESPGWRERIQNRAVSYVKASSWPRNLAQAFKKKSD